MWSFTASLCEPANEAGIDQAHISRLVWQSVVHSGHELARSLSRRVFCLERKGAGFGIQIDTWDEAPLEICDLLWLLDLPPSRKEFEQIRSQLRPGTPIILQVFESPAIAPFGLISANRKLVSAVVTYEIPDTTGAISEYFHYRLPVPILWPVKNPPFLNARVC